MPPAQGSSPWLGTCHHGRMSQDPAYRSLSFWLDTAPDKLVPGEPLDGDAEVDVAIAGAGFTGLWTAYYLAKADPGLRSWCASRTSPAWRVGPERGLVLGAVPRVTDQAGRMAGREAAVAM